MALEGEGAVCALWLSVSISEMQGCRGMQALKCVMRNRNEVPDLRERSGLRRMILLVAFWSSGFVRSQQAGRGGMAGLSSAGLVTL